MSNDRVIIWGYIPTFVDDTDIIHNALSSLARIPVDKIIVIDGGLDHCMMHIQRNFVSFEEWFQSRSEFQDGKWMNIPLVLLKNIWVTPGQQRNFALDWMASQPDAPNWIIALDSDEVESTEAESQMRDYLESLPADATNVVQPLLNLAQDEHHCAGGRHSGWMSHSRLHRLGTVRYSEEWHENQVFSGKRIHWNSRIIHTRMLFRKRLFVQRNAPTLKEAWRDVEMVDVPPDVHWTPLMWPTDEKIIPFLADVRNYD